MAFELSNTAEDLKKNLGWLYFREYEKEENQVTEALFKWFFFSGARIQRLFLRKVCGLRARGAHWKSFNLQPRGKTGMPDAVVHLRDRSQVLFEVKIKPDSVSRGQIKRHLEDAGLKRRRIGRNLSPPS